MAKISQSMVIQFFLSYESKGIVEQAHPILRRESPISESRQQRGEHVSRVGDSIEARTTRVQLGQ